MNQEEQILRLFKIYKTVKMASKAKEEHGKLKRMIDDHWRQTDIIMDASGLVERVRSQKVRPEDARLIGRMAVRTAPRVHSIISKYIRKNKNAKT